MKRRFRELSSRFARIVCWFLGLFWKDKWVFCGMCQGSGLLTSGVELRWPSKSILGLEPPSSIVRKGSPYPPSSMMYDAENDYEGGRDAEHYAYRGSLYGEACPECCGLRKTMRRYQHNRFRRQKLLLRRLIPSTEELWRNEFRRRKRYSLFRKKPDPKIYDTHGYGSANQDEPIWRNEGE